MPTATKQTLGVIKVGNGLNITEEGLLSVMADHPAPSVDDITEIVNTVVENTIENYVLQPMIWE